MPKVRIQIRRGLQNINAPEGVRRAWNGLVVEAEHYTPAQGDTNHTWYRVEYATAMKAIRDIDLGAHEWLNRDGVLSSLQLIFRPCDVEVLPDEAKP